VGSFQKKFYFFTPPLLETARRLDRRQIEALRRPVRGQAVPGGQLLELETRELFSDPVETGREFADFLL
jgi:hypothetical protein